MHLLNAPNKFVFLKKVREWRNVANLCYHGHASPECSQDKKNRMAAMADEVSYLYWAYQFRLASRIVVYVSACSSLSQLAGSILENSNGCHGRRHSNGMSLD